MLDIFDDLDHQEINLFVFVKSDCYWNLFGLIQQVELIPPLNIFHL